MPDTNNISLIIDLCGNNIKKACCNIVNTHLPKNLPTRQQDVMATS